MLKLNSQRNVQYSEYCSTIWCADAAGVARADAKLSRLHCAMRIPTRNVYVIDMCAFSADEVLLALGAPGLRTVSLHTAQLVAHEPTAIRYVYGVAFDAHTDTLLLLVWATTGDYYQLVSLRRNASEWLEVQRLGTRIRHSSNIDNFAVCDSRVLLVERRENTMYVFDVSAKSTLRDAGNVTLQRRFWRLACTRRNVDTLIAFSHETSVSLLRLTSQRLRLEPLASLSLTAPRRLLFREDRLLVADWKSATNTHAIVSFRATDNALTERRVLLDAQAGVDVNVLALAGDRLILFNSRLEEILVCDFT